MPRSAHARGARRSSLTLHTDIPHQHTLISTHIGLDIQESSSLHGDTCGWWPLTWACRGGVYGAENAGSDSHNMGLKCKRLHGRTFARYSM